MNKVLLNLLTPKVVITSSASTELVPNTNSEVAKYVHIIANLKPTSPVPSTLFLQPNRDDSLAIRSSLCLLPYKPISDSSIFYKS